MRAIAMAIIFAMSTAANAEDDGMDLKRLKNGSYELTEKQAERLKEIIAKTAEIIAAQSAIIEANRKQNTMCYKSRM